jgi:hypothetical protein
MRRRNSLEDIEQKSGAILEKELNEIDKHYDFDVPSAIDWELLIV